LRRPRGASLSSWQQNQFTVIGKLISSQFKPPIANVSTTAEYNRQRRHCALSGIPNDGFLQRKLIRVQIK